jgi:hypothetical protein
MEADNQPSEAGSDIDRGVGKNPCSRYALIYDAL